MKQLEKLRWLKWVKETLQGSIIQCKNDTVRAEK